MNQISYNPLRADEKEELISFLMNSSWPFHSTKNPTSSTYAQAFENGHYHNNNKTYWIEHSEEKVGLIIIEDINDDIPELNIRIASNFRGEGLGKRALQWVTEYIFSLPDRKVRIEAHTRVDNIAMRKTLASCSYVKEGYLRDAWENDDGTINDCMCYAMIRRDWENNTMTQIELNDEPF